MQNQERNPANSRHRTACFHEETQATTALKCCEELPAGGSGLETWVLTDSAPRSRQGSDELWQGESTSSQKKLVMGTDF